jgi:hypothetical protein
MGKAVQNNAKHVIAASDAPGACLEIRVLQDLSRSGLSMHGVPCIRDITMLVDLQVRHSLNRLFRGKSHFFENGICMAMSLTVLGAKQVACRHRPMPAAVCYELIMSMQRNARRCTAGQSS